MEFPVDFLSLGRGSISLAHGASTAQLSRAQLFRKSHIATEQIQLRQSSPRSLDSSVLKSLIAQLRPGSPEANSAQAV